MKATEAIWIASSLQTGLRALATASIRHGQHSNNGLSKRMFKKPEYCAAYHKQFIDQEVNRVGWVQLQNQYDNWPPAFGTTKATRALPSSAVSAIIRKTATRKNQNSAV